TRRRRRRAVAHQGGGARLGRFLAALVGTGRGSGTRDAGRRAAGQTLGRGTAAIRSARCRISAYGVFESRSVAAFTNASSRPVCWWFSARNRQFSPSRRDISPAGASLASHERRSHSAPFPNHRSTGGRVVV